jgi:hypothetical protein
VLALFLLGLPESGKASRISFSVRNHTAEPRDSTAGGHRDSTAEPQHEQVDHDLSPASAEERKLAYLVQDFPQSKEDPSHEKAEPTETIVSPPFANPAKELAHSQADPTNASASVATGNKKASLVEQVVASSVTKEKTLGGTARHTNVLENRVVVGIVALLVLVFVCCLRCVPAMFSKDSERKKARGASRNSSPKSVRFSAATKKRLPTERKQHIVGGQLLFEWNQTADAANVYITVPAGLEKPELEIIFEKRRLTVGCRGRPPFMCEHTYDAVSTSRSAWRLRSNGELQIRLRKETDGHWPHVVAPEAAPEIAPEAGPSA